MKSAKMKVLIRTLTTSTFALLSQSPLSFARCCSALLVDSEEADSEVGAYVKPITRR